MQQTAGDNSLQIQGENVHVGMSYADVKDLCTTLIRSEIASYEQKANSVAQERFESIMSKLLEALSKIDEQYRMRFQEPSIQFAAQETFKEYIRSGKEELSDDLIDLMIERIKVDEHTTKQALIDEARQILPKLSTSAIAILAILALSKLLILRNRGAFIENMRSLTPLVKEIGTPRSLDIAYLEQVRCGQVLSFISSFKAFSERMLEAYLPVFTHSITVDQFNKIASELGLNLERPQLLVNILSLFETKDNLMTLNISVLSEDMFLSNKEEIVNVLRQFVEKMTKYTKEEVEQFFLEIDNQWQNVIDLFNRKDIRSFMVSPVGYYIGSRKLCKVLGEEIPIGLFFND